LPGANNKVLLARFLENEAAYLEHVGKGQKAATLRERCRRAGEE
jgi:hypothetical protein